MLTVSIICAGGTCISVGRNYAEFSLTDLSQELTDDAKVLVQSMSYENAA